MSIKAKPMPSLKSDADAEAFTDEADLTDYDLSGFKTMRFEIAPEGVALNVRLPGALLEAVEVKAKARGISYARYVQMLLEADVAQPR